MSYTAGTQPGSASIGSDWATTLHTILTAAGFTWVEDFTVTTDVTKVYKSPAASNGIADWYLYSRRGSAGPDFRVSVSEAWDATGKKIQQYVPASSGTPNGSYQVNDATGVAPNSNTNLNATCTLNAAGFQYWVSANTSRVIVATRSATTDTGVYAGLLDEVMPATVPGAGVQLMVSNLAPLNINSTPSAVGGGYTREPNQAGANSANFAGGPYAQWGFASSTLDVYSGKPWATRILCCGRAGNMPRGLAKDVLVVPGIASAANGDTITFSTKTFTKMCTGLTTSYFVDQAV